MPPPFARPLIGPKEILSGRVVRQQMEGYLPGEIAHIENVMGSETRVREHRRLSRRESEFEETRELENERERDTQTTERYELEREMNNVQRQQESFNVGGSVSGGTEFFQVEAHAEYTFDASHEESRRSAEKYAREVVEKALDRVKETVSEKRLTRTLEQIEELNSHTFTNTGPEARHISGIFRWVDAVYRCKVEEVERKLVYEFLVPEPAAHYRYLMRKAFP